MSPRAACRLVTLGFGQVYEYAAGKVDWLAAGYPTVGPGARTLRAGTVARRDVPTCRLNESLGTIRARVADRPEDRCIVVSDAGIVLGTVSGDALSDPSAETAVDVMRPGPTTVRAHEDLSALAARMRERHVDSILVTDPEGQLLGLLYLGDAEGALG